MTAANLIRWIQERENVRIRRATGAPKPWTDDPILQAWSFCNVRREDDRVTRWIAANWRDPNAGDPDVWFAMAVARCVNWPDSLAEIGYPTEWQPERFVAALEDRATRRKADKKTKVFGDAYNISNGGSSEPKALHIAGVLTSLWDRRARVRPKSGDSLLEFYGRLKQCDGFGGSGFMAAQVIADAKYVGLLKTARDWMTFAAPGPGSMRGLNWVLNRPTDARWREPDWLAALRKLRDEIAPELARIGLEDLHAQDLQNCLCEFDKNERMRLGEGKPKRKFVPHEGATASTPPPPNPGVAAKKKPSIAVDLSEAARFLACLDPDARFFTFQTFDDDSKRKDSKLVKVLHGTLDQHATALTKLSAQGAGIFVTVNETDGRGRRAENIVRVRSVFVDLDGSPLDPVIGSEPKPQIVTETSPDRWHCYWRVKNLPLDQFTIMQKALIERFGGDPAVHDLPRVMRLPGFVHRKGEPYLSRILSTSENAPYEAAELPTANGALNPDILALLDQHAGEGIVREPDSEWKKLNTAALQNLSAWVPALLPAAVFNRSTGGYRVTSKALGRNLQEDLSITPNGIVDFGVADMGDPRQGRRTAIDLVREHRGKEFLEAAEWLRERLGGATKASEAPASATTKAAPATTKRPQGMPQLAAFLNSAADLQKMTFDPLRWIVPDYLPEGLTVLGGKPKIGKSWCALEVAVGVATGGECLGKECEQGDVLALFLEDNKRRLQRRLTKMLGAYKEKWPDRLTYATDWPRLASGGIDLIREWIGTVPKPRLVIIDILERVRQRDKNRHTPQYSADYEALAALQKLATEAQLSILVLHHQRKMGADDLIDTLSGTLGIGGAVDAILILGKDDTGNFLYGRGRDLEEFAVAVQQDERCRWQVLGPKPDAQASPERGQIVAALAKAGKPMTVEAIATALGMKKANVKNLLSKLHFDGEVERVATGLYKPADPQASMNLGDGGEVDAP